MTNVFDVAGLRDTVAILNFLHNITSYVFPVFQQWDEEWKNVVKSAEDQKNSGSNPNRLPYESLEEIHIFMLSNILRRPIIVLGDTVIRGISGRTLANNNFVGMYLPLLWKPSECTKSPIVLGFASNHFVPLVAMEEDLGTGSVSVAAEAVPVVTNTLTFIGIHFLMQDEEDRVGAILQDYVNITEIPVTQNGGLTLVLSAKLHMNKLPDRYNLMIDFVQAAERVFAGKEAILPSSQQNDLAATRTFNPDERSRRANLGERGEGTVSNSYLASRERQQRILEHQHASLRPGPQDQVNFNVDNKPKPHQKQNIPPRPDKEEKMGKFLRDAKAAQLKELHQSMKCKTPKCGFYGLEEHMGFCSSCFQEHRSRLAAARRAAAGTFIIQYLAPLPSKSLHKHRAGIFAEPPTALELWTQTCPLLRADRLRGLPGSSVARFRGCCWATDGRLFLRIEFWWCPEKRFVVFSSRWWTLLLPETSIAMAQFSLESYSFEGILPFVYVVWHFLGCSLFAKILKIPLKALCQRSWLIACIEKQFCEKGSRVERSSQDPVTGQ